MNTFSALLDALAAAPLEQQPALAELILNTFQRRKTVLALDMSGFTLSVRRDGILSYLCQVRRMQKLTQPIVKSFEGEMVKFQADNLMAVFDDPQQAVEAAMEMNRAAERETIAGSPPLAFSIGIDYGDLLLLDHVDCFGDPVNLAYKLGEDIAQPGEVLITWRVREQLGGNFAYDLRELVLSVSGVEITAFAVSERSS